MVPELGREVEVAGVAARDHEVERGAGLGVDEPLRGVDGRHGLCDGVDGVFDVDADVLPLLLPLLLAERILDVEDPHLLHEGALPGLAGTQQQ